MSNILKDDSKKLYIMLGILFIVFFIGIFIFIYFIYFSKVDDKDKDKLNKTLF